MTVVRRRKSLLDSSDDDDDATSPRPQLQTNAALDSSASLNNVAIAESKVRKVIIRSVVGFVMVTSFVGIVWAGHLYLSALVVLIQVS